ncbi:MAG: LamG domain-containing protein, partial [Phycisphaerales bacterium]
SASTLPPGWHHLAVTIDSATMTASLYVDGALADSGETATLPKDLGTPTQNWLGRSQYAADGYFTGSLADLAIYNRALSAGEVRYLAGDR